MISNSITFEEGCEKYLDNCRARNLRQGTINHYKQSYTQFFKYFPREKQLEEFSQKEYNDYVCYLRKTIQNDVSINSYLRDFITTFHFLMKEGYVEPFKMQAIKVDKTAVETYSEKELEKLLKKPDLKKCGFAEYQSWVMTNFLFSTGVRQKSLNNIKIKDVDLENRVVNITFTKNRKPLLVPLNETMKNILIEYFVMDLIIFLSNPLINQQMMVA